VVFGVRTPITVYGLSRDLRTYDFCYGLCWIVVPCYALELSPV